MKPSPEGSQRNPRKRGPTTEETFARRETTAVATRGRETQKGTRINKGTRERRGRAGTETFARRETTTAGQREKQRGEEQQADPDCMEEFWLAAALRAEFED